MKASTIRHRQRGLTTVEFSIVGVALMVVLFGVLELSRLMFDSGRAAGGYPPGGASRRGLPYRLGEHSGYRRLLAICTDFGPGNVQVLYLTAAGIPTFAYANISYVQVSIVDYAIQLAIPFINPVVNSPAFTTTLPRESLGVSGTGFTPCG